MKKMKAYVIHGAEWLPSSHSIFTSLQSTIANASQARKNVKYVISYFCASKSLISNNVSSSASLWESLGWLYIAYAPLPLPPPPLAVRVGTVLGGSTSFSISSRVLILLLLSLLMVWGG